MSNMSYCRFQNTLRDLQDCHDALEDLRDTYHEALAYKELLPQFKAATAIVYPTDEQEMECDEMAEELDRLRNRVDPLSAEEYRAAGMLIELCDEISSNDIGEDDLPKESDYEI